MATNDTFLLDNIEVVLTGRVAHRVLRSGNHEERSEVQPAESSDGTWKRWVKTSELYTISTP